METITSSHACNSSMMPCNVARNWLSKQFKVRPLELVKATKENGKTTKETPTTTITPTTTTTTVTETTITNNKTGGRKRARCLCCSPTENRGLCWESYKEQHLATFTIVGDAPPNWSESAKDLVMLGEYYSEKSFISSVFTPFIDIAPTALNTSYEVELADGKVAKFLGKKKFDDIRVVRDFPEVFPDDLSGLPPVREIEFHIVLNFSARQLLNHPYRDLAPHRCLELSEPLNELQEKEVYAFDPVIHHGVANLLLSKRKKKNRYMMRDV
ncbi:hypothetical protein Tco_1483397 [Tanacetum coccineum]